MSADTQPASEQPCSACDGDGCCEVCRGQAGFVNALGEYVDCPACDDGRCQECDPVLDALLDNLLATSDEDIMAEVAEDAQSLTGYDQAWRRAEADPTLHVFTVQRNRAEPSRSYAAASEDEAVAIDRARAREQRSGVTPGGEP